MNINTEKAFRKADSIARKLGDLKYYIYDVKANGGIGDKEKLEWLLGLEDTAKAMFKELSDDVSIALDAVYKEDKDY